MLYEDKFIQEHYNRYRLMKYLENRLERAGLANVEIQRTPLMTRINLEVLSPARIIGRKGRLINELTDEVKRVFGIENPQISVAEIREPLLEPRIVARKAARHIEMGKKVRAVLHFFLREILSRGALGAEIVASGKIGAKGARAKSLRVSSGYIPTAGEPARLVRVAHLNANTKSGVIGVLVRIVPPGTVFPDKPSPEEEKPNATKEKKPVEAKPEEKTEAKPEEKAATEEAKPVATPAAPEEAQPAAKPAATAPSEEKPPAEAPKKRVRKSKKSEEKEATDAEPAAEAEEKKEGAEKEEAPPAEAEKKEG